MIIIDNTIAAVVKRLASCAMCRGLHPARNKIYLYRLTDIFVICSRSECVCFKDMCVCKLYPRDGRNGTVGQHFLKRTQNINHASNWKHVLISHYIQGKRNRYQILPIWIYMTSMLIGDGALKLNIIRVFFVVVKSQFGCCNESI